MRGRFGEYTFDTATRVLERAGEPLHMSPKAFDLLQTLIEARPRALSKEEILGRVWAGTFVSDGTLTVVVAELRNILGDEPREPRFIRTVQRFGYAFCGDFVPAAGENRAAYRLLWGAREIALSEGTNILGRCPEAVAWISDSSISRRHALIEISPGDVVIEDLGSRNGTFVGGSRISTPKRLVDGDSITLGRVPMTFRMFQDGGPTTSFSVARS
ncbi:MAG TPA: winged helix-turn-helix domain-containing protein [Thermoanaerobaculia bacterium]|nr:winged helix-turn-helix domain-containing protein [Thermoanaerobaculia bacterium]